MDGLPLNNTLAAVTALVFSFIGVLWLSLKILSFWRLIASLFILPGTSLSKFGKRETWAVVTGASDGIGKEYAQQLAGKGYNILLVSRTKSKLDTLASEISAKYKVETRVLAMDFAADKDTDYASLKELVNGLDVSILINNVGQSHNIPVPFNETPEKELRDIITINCMGTLRVTQLVTPGMIKRKRGLILTMASFGGIMPTPLLATYSGSKAFLQQWSSALSSELASSNIKVQLVQSYLVTSAMSKIKRPSLLIPTPKKFVRAALSSIGRHGGAQGVPATCTPYWSHAIMQWAISTFVGTQSEIVLWINKSMHQGIRKRALRKAERDAKKA
ncbi:3-ketoacyl-CoA reductase like protein [Zymoseptoria brevis]|uniref:Very-long-chain 3-oxoacyl-CoA reductase n=1 Tax=Zymoseptoria brevis TaxID=1047168 RepID=A0A0F4GS36_9PEZI|nr:3-ketoacyl-CoA reductase like protein [Zymoseptoria brevis]